MVPVLAIVLLLLLAGVWWLLRIRRQSQRTGPGSAQPASDRNTAFHAVTIEFQEDACEAARSMAGRRYLSEDAPKLPLPECDAADCKCRFVHHDDRRGKQDRRGSPGTLGPNDETGTFEIDKRASADRRDDNSEP